MLRAPLLAVAALVLLALPPDTPHAGEAKLDRLLDLMRTGEVLRGMPEAVMEGIDAEPSAWGRDLSRAALKAAAEKHFGAAVLDRDLRALMPGLLTDAELDAAIAFYDTDFGRHVVAEEVAASDPALAATFETAGARLYRALVDAEADRVTQINRIIEATGALERDTAIAMNMAYAMLTAVLASADSPILVSEEEILALINAAMPAMRADLVDALNGQIAYTYRRLSDAEFERYVAVMESAEGRALSAALLDATRTSLIERARAFGHDIRVLSGQRKS